MCNAIDWLADQLSARETPPPPRRNNPRPPGVIRPGSGTDMLLCYLRQHPARWHGHQELVLTLGRSKNEVDWGIKYLVRQHLLVAEQVHRPGGGAVMRYRLVG